MSFHKPIITEVTPDDFRPMIELRRELYFEQAVAAGVPEENAAAHIRNWGGPESLRRVGETWGKLLARPEQNYLRVVRVGECLGGILMAATNYAHFPGQGYVSDIELVPSLRNQGLGSELMHGVLAWFGDRRANLHVFEGNEAGCRFYARLGFIDTGSKEAQVIGGHKTYVKLLSRD